MDAMARGLFRGTINRSLRMIACKLADASVRPGPARLERHRRAIPLEMSNGEDHGNADALEKCCRFVPNEFRDRRRSGYAVPQAMFSPGRGGGEGGAWWPN